MRVVEDITAVEFLKQKYNIESSSEAIRMIEFAKIHVKNSQEAIYKKGFDIINQGEGNDYIDIEEIINAYPLDKIK